MRFNIFKKKEQAITNYEGGLAYKMSVEEELYTAVVTTGLNHSFYESDPERLIRIVDLVGKCDPRFVAKLAVYTRTKMNLRSVSLVLMIELAKIHSGDSLVSKGINGVIRRADEITELLAYYQLSNKRNGVKKLNKLSKQVQKGIAMAFNKFDEYQFAKYNRKTEIELRDALFITHPKAVNEAQQVIFNKIANNNLDVPYTWETELSAVGQLKIKDVRQRNAAVCQKWEELIESKKLGYMALLRNLRNIIEANVSIRHVYMVCDIISNEKQVARSRQLPFRFLAAYREVKILTSAAVSPILDALEDAVLYSASNIKGFDYNTSIVIACDVSGSMQKAISPRSKISLYDIGLMLGMMMQNRCKNVVSGMFGDRWKVINMPKRSILSNVDEYYKREGEVGYSTNGHLVIQDLITRKQKVDKVMLFTDTQMWNSTRSAGSFESMWNTYKSQVAPNAKLYLFDLAGYGQMPISIKKNDVFLIAGWSDKLFEILAAIESGSSAVAEIYKVEL